MKNKTSKTDELRPLNKHIVVRCAFLVGDKIKWNDVQRGARGEEFTGGKKVETIVKIDYSNKPKETRLWLSNGLHINPECVVKA